LQVLYSEDGGGDSSSFGSFFMAIETESRTAQAVRMRTYAKLNLFLRVLGPRADGYHEIETILHGIKLADDVEIIPTSTGKVDIEMTLADHLRGDVPAPEENVIWEVASSLLERGAHNDGVLIRINKRIPIGAGLGGGSGNAAGALVVLNELWDTGLDNQELLKSAGALGSDVPYCIGGGTALATARGDELTPLPAPDALWFVLGISHEPLFTKDIYGMWEALGAGPEVKSAPMTLALGGGDPAEIASLLHNDLESVVIRLRPELLSKKETMQRAGALGSCITGSGPTVFGMARDETHAHEIASEVTGEFDHVMVVPSSTICIERVE
jgi:4-diphosphocytidyl-2-C-methyl-D-erythritol kinase